MTIPVDFIPDAQFAKARDAAFYSIAPGTKTLEAQALDVTKAKNIADAVQARKNAEESARQADMENKYKYADLAETTRGNNLQSQYQMGSLANDAAKTSASVAAASNTAAAKNVLSESAAYKNHALLVMQSNYANAKSKSLTNYNFASYVDYMKAKGAWDLMTDADKTAVIKAADSLSKGLGGV